MLVIGRLGGSLLRSIIFSAARLEKTGARSLDHTAGGPQHPTPPGESQHSVTRWGFAV